MKKEAGFSCVFQSFEISHDSEPEFIMWIFKKDYFTCNQQQFYHVKNEKLQKQRKISDGGGNRKNMINDLQLYIPSQEDGWFYVKMMTDPDTMAYNAPWFPPDGCIPEPESEWLEIQNFWIGNEPERLYAFLQRKCDGVFVGDVNYHYNPKQNWYDIGIVIYAPERGKGYGKQGLHLLLDRAFKVDGVPILHNDFETTRSAAYHIHKTVGFQETGIDNGIVRLEIKRDEFINSVL